MTTCPDLTCRCGLMVVEDAEQPFYRCHGCFKTPQDCTCPVHEPQVVPDAPESGPLASFSPFSLEVG